MPCNNKNNFEVLNACASGSGFNYITNGGGIKEPFTKKDNSVYVPYVLFVLGDKAYSTADPLGQNVTTAGNNEYKFNNSYIQSFEMTIGTSFEGNITLVTCDFDDVKKLISIVPKEGCKWDKFIMGNESGDASLAKAYIDIGWIIRGCNDSVDKYGMQKATSNNNNSYKIISDGKETTSGPYIYGLMQSVNVSSDAGVYKVSIKFTDGFGKTEESRLDNIVFSEKLKGALKGAIDKFAKFNCENKKEDGLTTVAFVTIPTKPNQKITEWEFMPDQGGKNGVFNVFNPNRLSLFQYYRELLNGFQTNSKKGFNFAYDNGSKGKPSILMIEDRKPNWCLGEKGETNYDNIPTYIVGGGDCSPVIKFNTQFQATPLARVNPENNESPKLKAGTGGGGPSGTGQGVVQIPSCSRLKNLKTGQSGEPTVTSTYSNGPGVNISPTPATMNDTPPSRIAAIKIETLQANLIAGVDLDNLPIVGPIKADLEIHGDPYWANTVNWLKTPYIKIIFIDPYCVKVTTNENGACESLAKSACNKELSQVYQVKSCRSTINSGSYTTTLELYSINIMKF